MQSMRMGLVHKSIELLEYNICHLFIEFNWFFWSLKSQFFC